MDAPFFAEHLRRHAQATPDALAQTFGDQRLTFAELDGLSSRCANALVAAGVKPGDRVACLAKNNAWFFVLWYGCVKAGACLAPVNWRLAPPEVAFILKDQGAHLLFVDAAFEPVVDLIAADLSLTGIVCFDADHPRWPAFDAWIGAHDDQPPARTPAGDDDVIQLYTSGTTGLPKGVMLTEDNYRVLLSRAVEAGWARYQPGDAVLLLMPLFHVAGVNMGPFAFSQGARVVIMPDVVPAEILRLIAAERIQNAFMAPTIINMCLQTPGVERTDFSSLQRITYGASPIAEEVLRQAQARFGCEFHQLYGLTETAGAGAHLGAEEHDPARGRLRAAGRPWPGLELRCVTPEGHIAKVGEVGEVQIRGGTVMKGYWNRPKATAEAVDADGWFRSGDAGYFDADGFLYIHDRVKDMIVSGGENVYPAEVENALFAHPAVADAAVIGVPDDRWGEAVKAVVVLREGQAAEARELILHCRSLIAAYKAPKSVDFVEALPRNPSGKVLRRELRAPFWEGRGRNVG